MDKKCFRVSRFNVFMKLRLSSTYLPNSLSPLNKINLISFAVILTLSLIVAHLCLKLSNIQVFYILLNYKNCTIILFTYIMSCRVSALLITFLHF